MTNFTLQARPIHESKTNWTPTCNNSEQKGRTWQKNTNLMSGTDRVGIVEFLSVEGEAK
jgi:hypothetical protein